MNQAELFKRFQQGDKSVFPQLLALTQDMVYNTALGIVQVEADAEDICQDVFITIYEQATYFRGDADWKTWIYRICIRKALDHEKKKKRLKHGGLWKRVFSPSVTEMPVDFNHPGVLYGNKEMARHLFAAIKKLPDRQRIAFVLQQLEGLSGNEIAAAMNITQDASASLLKRARQELKRELEKIYRDL